MLHSRSNFPALTSGLGALVAVLGLTARPADGGGFHHLHHRTSSQQLVSVQPASNFAIGTTHTLVSAGSSTAGFMMLPTSTGTASFFTAPAASSTAGFTFNPTNASFLVPTASFTSSSGLVPVSPGTAAFSTDEMAAYNTSPNLAAHLGANFATFQRGLVAHAQSIKASGTTGFQPILQALRQFATNFLPKLAPTLAGTIGGPFGSAITSEIETLIGGIAATASTSPVGVEDGTGGAATTSAPIIINITCDGKTTTHTINPSTSKGPTGTPAAPQPGAGVPVTPGHTPGQPPAAPAARDSQTPGVVSAVPTKTDAQVTKDEDTSARLSKVADQLEQIATTLAETNKLLKTFPNASTQTAPSTTATPATTTGGTTATSPK
jgi:hypothetical protein